MSKKYHYMSTRADFGLLGAVGSSLAGGALYGGGYSLSKLATNPEDMTPEDVKKEMLANAVGGAVSGLGLYAASKIPTLRNKLPPLK
jgi:hypothetical protein